ncbi:MAG: PPC domain-containing DNA-binding protein [Dermatophilaceae bacterium]
MRSHELSIGRTFAVSFDHGEDFFATLAAFCRDRGVRQGYVPMFIAGFSEVEIVGSCEKLADPDAPVWSRVHLSGVEAIGGGTLAHDPDTGDLLPHLHVSVGEKSRSAVGHTSHLLAATVQFLVEMVVVEVIAPAMTRPLNADLYGVPTLTFGHPDAPHRPG